VAPGATWIAAVGLDEGRYNNALLTRAADWMLNVGRPDVLIVAWRAAGIGCKDSLRTIVNAWRAADIVVVFAAGNGGPASRSDVAPANAAKLFPGSAAALSVGAVDARANPYEASSRGPSRCSGTVYPQLVAPGADVLVALPAGENLYRRASGTSFAAGYVAGAAALLRQRFPEAHAGEIERALWRSATDLGPRGPDSTFGHGLVSVPRAMGLLSNASGR
jgi:bacillopeptidase F